MLSIPVRLCRHPRPDLRVLSLALAATFSLLAAPAVAADPLSRGGSHVGEDHSDEIHSGANLRGIDLSLADLSRSDLSGSNFKEGLFVDALLVDTDLTSTELEDANFTGADLTGADLGDANAEGAIFTDALLIGALFDGTDLEDSVFAGAELMGADLSNAVKADRADFDGSYFDATTLLSPDMDTSGMYEVMGACPSDPEMMLVDMDGDHEGDECHELHALPEPGALSLVAAGGALVVGLSRRRRQVGPGRGRCARRIGARSAS
jgi:hypothetical protein